MPGLMVGPNWPRDCLVPGDKDARLKMQECEKIVREAQFLEAIGQSEPQSAAEGLDLDNMGGYFCDASKAQSVYD